MRACLAIMALCACGNDEGRTVRAPTSPPPSPAAPRDAASVAPPDAAPAAPPAGAFADLGAALVATIPDDARVIGFGELHARTDRAHVRSALAHFTAEALPAIGDKLSDLVVETWIPPKDCEKQAEHAQAQVADNTKRPVETKSEIAELAEAARAKTIQPHAMRVTCDDFKKLLAAKPDDQLVELLALTTRELGRIAGEAVAHRDREPNHRPWIALYGGALHNDRFPAKALAEFSYAAKVDAATQGHFVEIDVIVPEFAEADPAAQKEPWFAAAHAADAWVHVWKRGERSFVVILARTAS